MAVMTDAQRASVWQAIMEGWPAGEECSLSKTDLRAVINHADVWLNDFGGSHVVAAGEVGTNVGYAQSMPQPGRGALSNRSKAFILSRVLAERFSLGV